MKTGESKYLKIDISDKKIQQDILPLIGEIKEEYGDWVFEESKVYFLGYDPIVSRCENKAMYVQSYKNALYTYNLRDRYPRKLESGFVYIHESRYEDFKNFKHEIEIFDVRRYEPHYRDFNFYYFYKKQ